MSQVGEVEMFGLKYSLGLSTLSKNSGTVSPYPQNYSCISDYTRPPEEKFKFTILESCPFIVAELDKDQKVPSLIVAGVDYSLCYKIHNFGNSVPKSILLTFSIVSSSNEKIYITNKSAFIEPGQQIQETFSFKIDQQVEFVKISLDVETEVCVTENSVEKILSCPTISNFPCQDVFTVQIVNILPSKITGKCLCQIFTQVRSPFIREIEFEQLSLHVDSKSLQVLTIQSSNEKGYTQNTLKVVEFDFGDICYERNCTLKIKIRVILWLVCA